MYKIHAMSTKQLKDELKHLEFELEHKLIEKEQFPPTTFMGTLYISICIETLKNKIDKIKIELTDRAGGDL